jgi:hypothetical protein
MGPDFTFFLLGLPQPQQGEPAQSQSYVGVATVEELLNEISMRSDYFPQNFLVLSKLPGPWNYN